MAPNALNWWSPLWTPVRQMFHGHQRMKCYPWTCPMPITECCDLDTDVPWALMNEVLPRDQSYAHCWMLWLGDRCSMGIDESSTTQGLLWLEDGCSTGIDKSSTTPALVLWPLLNVVTWRQMFHGHRWMKCYPGTSPMSITECCDLGTGVPWASMNEVLPRDQSYGHYWMLWLGAVGKSLVPKHYKCQRSQLA
jgi:hypothetical protein